MTSEDRLNGGEFRVELGEIYLLIRSAILYSSSYEILYTNILVLLFYVLATCLNMFYHSYLCLELVFIETIGDVGERSGPGIS